jgi:hypothetical protein
MWTYKQSTGELLRDENLIATGYSGFGEGKNNSSLQHVQGVGPIPIGMYVIGKPYDTVDHGPHVLRLIPLLPSQTFGRSGFLMHGDSKEHPGTASHGCIIMPRAIREQVAASGDHDLKVIA